MTSVRLKKKRAKSNIAKPCVIGFRIATVNATISQLKEIGIDEDLNGREVKVYDIDKYGGMYPPCSKIIVDNQFEWLKEKGIDADYIFPTRWLQFADGCL